MEKIPINKIIKDPYSNCKIIDNKLSIAYTYKLINKVGLKYIKEIFENRSCLLGEIMIYFYYDIDKNETNVTINESEKTKNIILNKYKKCKYPYMAVHVRIINIINNKKMGGHSNFIFINTQKTIKNEIIGKIEHYEPDIHEQGYITPIDIELKKFFKSLFPTFYYEDLDTICPNYISPQTINKDEFCYAWSLYWIILRMNNSKVPVEYINEYLIENAKNKIENFIKCISKWMEDYTFLVPLF